MKTIVALNIQPKPYRGRHAGVIRKTDGEFNAEIIPGVQIRIWGHYNNSYPGPKSFDRTFTLGDPVEHDSFNLVYIGQITKITKKTIIIRDQYGTRSTRLDLHDFIWRNWDFDLENAKHHNDNWLD